MIKGNKIIWVLILILNSNNFSAQSLSLTPGININVPQVIGPSPTVSSLMKFEEIPINSYTGNPDISVPLFNIPSMVKDFNFDVSIKYHPASIAINEKSSDIGLGWNLFAGGVISRTVRGIADESFKLESTSKPGSIGIYHNNNVSNHHNYYYDKISNLSQFAYQNPDAANQYYWDVVKRGKFDTEHDLWQFNFLGHTGRFYIKKNLQGILEILPLSDYRIKIINHYSTVNSNPYILSGFTVFDEKGFKYVFDLSEISTSAVATQITHANLNTQENIVANDPHISAFHLTKIYDNNNNLLINFEYYSQYKESYSAQQKRERYYNSISEDVVRNASCMGELPTRFNTITTNITATQKLKKIYIVKKGEINFTYTLGRNDTNINNGSDAARLTSITLKDNYGHEVKKYTFAQGYTQMKLNSRMVLNTISVSHGGAANSEKFEFSYKSILNGNYKKDNWGFLSYEEIADCGYKHSESLNPYIHADTDVLQAIKYPTGGAAVFSYESNTYSYIGADEITNFESNHENLIKTKTLSYNFTANGTFLLPSVVDTIAVFRPSITLPMDQTMAPVHMFLRAYENQGQLVESTNLICSYTEPGCCIKKNLKLNRGYSVTRNALNLNYNDTDGVSIDFYKKKFPENKYLYGGGIRIKEILYFDTDINIHNQDIYSSASLNPTRRIKYSYNFSDNNNQSSGALVHAAPNFEKDDGIFVNNRCIDESGEPHTTQGVFSYHEISDYSETPIISTQGAYVGYKNVRIKEEGNGYRDISYTSPIDYPSYVSYEEPFVSLPDLEYKRGLMLTEKIYNESNQKLKASTNIYSFDDQLVVTGHKFWQLYGYKGNLWNNYSEFKTALTQSTLYLPASFYITNGISRSMVASPSEMISNKPILEAYGWSKLSSTNTKNYFYENGVAKILENNESFEYNPINKMISQYTSINEEGTELKTKYFYHSGNSTYSQNRISEIEKIESYRNGKLLDTKKINYANNWTSNVSYLPQQIQTSFGSGNAETEVTYDQYDSKGNLLQYTTKDGLPTAVIWGYDGTQPIAKITGATYAQVSSLASAIVTASDTDAAAAVNNDETSLLTALDNFRKTSALPGYQITTYTYDPLIGIRSITPPSGIREVYLYDAANRLKEIRENNATGKVLKEFKYNYKQ